MCQPSWKGHEFQWKFDQKYWNFYGILIIMQFLIWLEYRGYFDLKCYDLGSLHAVKNLVWVLLLPFLYFFLFPLIFGMKLIKQLNHWRNQLNSVAKIYISLHCQQLVLQTFPERYQIECCTKSNSLDTTNHLWKRNHLYMVCHSYSWKI